MKTSYPKLTLLVPSEDKSIRWIVQVEIPVSRSSARLPARGGERPDPGDETHYDWSLDDFSIIEAEIDTDYSPEALPDTNFIRSELTKFPDEVIIDRANAYGWT